MPCNVFSYPGVCEDGSYYDANGDYYPGDKKLPFNNVPIDTYYNTCNYLYDKNCPNPNTMNDPLLPPNIRPITNTNYLSVPPVINQTQWSLSDLLNPQGAALANNAPSTNSVSGIMGTLQAHPVLALSGAALLLYFFMGSGGGTYEQITTKRKGFGS